MFYRSLNSSILRSNDAVPIRWPRLGLAIARCHIMCSSKAPADILELYFTPNVEVLLSSSPPAMPGGVAA